MEITKNGVEFGTISACSPSSDIGGSSKFVLDNGLAVYIKNEEVVRMYEMLKYYVEKQNDGKSFDELFTEHREKENGKERN